MKKAIVSMILAISLMITSCSVSNSTSQSESVVNLTEMTTTIEETTEVTTTTTKVKDPISSLPEVCEIATSSLGKDYDTVLALFEDAFATKLIFDTTEYHEAGEEYFNESKYSSYYNCDIVIDGYAYNSIAFGYHEDKIVDDISISYYSNDSSELTNRYEYIKAVLSSLLGNPSDGNTDNSMYDFSWTSYGPVDDVNYMVVYCYYGEDNMYNATTIGFFPEE